MVLFHANPSNAFWRKSSRSSQGGEHSNCVEVTAVEHAIAVRDSKAPAHGTLVFPTASWRRFLTQ